MKDWEWFALGLIPFAAMPVTMYRYATTGTTGGPAQFVAGAIAGQGVAWAMQRVGLGRVNEALLLYRAGSLGLVEEGAGRTGYSLARGTKVSGVRNIKGSGVGWRPTFAMRMLTPVTVGFLIGSAANFLRTDSPEYGDRYRSNRTWNQPDFDVYI